MKNTLRTAALLILLLTAASTALAAHGSAEGSVQFSQSVLACDRDGSIIPPHRFTAEGLEALPVAVRDLGDGRDLKIHCDLEVNCDRLVDRIAEIVGRCYEHLEAVTGRTVRGGVLLYLPAFEEPPASYAFAVDTDGSRWRQVRLAPLDADLVLDDPLDDPRLAELLLDTLPHELMHGLLSQTPTVRHDTTAAPANGTRWFIEGACEIAAKGFSAQESPAIHRRLLRERRVDTVLDRPGVRPALLDWRQDGASNAMLESDLYGAAYLLVREWTDAVPLHDLLAGLAADGGGHDGPELLGRFLSDTGADLLTLLNRAAERGRDLLPPSRLSAASP